MNPFDSCVFGKVHLGYLVIETNRFSDWKRFGRDAIGMHLDDALPDVMRFRLDDDDDAPDVVVFLCLLEHDADVFGDVHVDGAGEVDEGDGPVTVAGSVIHLAATHGEDEEKIEVQE